MRNAINSRFPLGRAIATCVVVFFLGVAGVCFFSSLVNRAYFRSQARFGCLMALSVDLSTPGTYSASFDYRPIIENAFLGLDVPKAILSETSPDVLVSGLQGTFTILDADGSRIFRGRLVQDPNNLIARHFKNLIQLVYLGSWYGEVKWQINVTITQGAPRLKGIPQRLVLFDNQHAFRFKDDFYTFFGSIVLLLAVIIFIVVAAAYLRKRKRLKNGQQIAGTDGV